MTGDNSLPQRRSAICSHMLGMIWNGNETLQEALHPKTKQVPPELFEKCHGICLLALVKGGVFFSFHASTGIMMAKDKETGKWSPPVAVYMGGYGMGAVAGYKDENVLLFIMDEKTMKEFSSQPQTRIGATAAATLCKSGFQKTRGIDLRHKKTITLAYSHYAFVGVTLEMHTLETAQNSKNTKFYGKNASVSDILFKDGAVQIPEDSLIPDIHKKLDMLAKGQTWLPGEEDILKTSRHAEIADLAELEIKEEKKEMRKRRRSSGGGINSKELKEVQEAAIEA